MENFNQASTFSFLDSDPRSGQQGWKWIKANTPQVNDINAVCDVLQYIHKALGGEL